MQSIRKSVLIAHSASDMFDLIDRVERYSQFLPWCSRVDVHEHTEEITDVTIHIQYMGLKTHFRTRNLNQRPERIDMQFVEGPFRQLTGSWLITPLDDQACKITFTLDYEFSSYMLEKVLTPVFDKISKTFVDAFVKEADRL